METVGKKYLESTIKQFRYYKQLGEKAINQINEHDLFDSPNSESNSIAIIVQHLSGNMLSRFTDFLISDGEKEWRNRDGEFEQTISNKQDLLDKWEEGWKCLFKVLESLNEEDLLKIIYIRNEGHTVVEAINRQLAHYPYHIGQIVYKAKISASQWTSLSIPKKCSDSYNQDKFSQEKCVRNFTDSLLDRKPL